MDITESVLKKSSNINITRIIPAKGINLDNLFEYEKFLHLDNVLFNIPSPLCECVCVFTKPLGNISICRISVWITEW